MPRLTIVNNSEVIKLSAPMGANLLYWLADNGFSFSAPCGGNGKCGKCKVKLEGNPCPPCDKEMEVLSDDELKNGFRLACHTEIHSDMTVYLQSNKASILTSGIGYSVTPDRGTSFGFAVDIGTTTVVAHLVDMTLGKIIATRSGLNAQRTTGADVISRIFYVATNPQSNLQTLINTQLEEMFISLCSDAKIDIAQVDEAVITGNTTMLHISAGIDISPLGHAPYAPLTTAEIVKMATDVNIHIDSLTIRYIPCISGFVGGDTVSAILSCKMHEFDGTALLIDIGTNGEIALGGKKGIRCCSTAAGPAFEGSNIECGVGGITGAVNRVNSNPFSYTTIDNAPPIGICGSGLIDLVSTLLKDGAIDETGRFVPDSDYSSYIEPYNKGYKFVLDSSAPSVYLTSKDIREVQLAKAAISAGLKVLLNDGGLDYSDVDKVYIAGGFGNNIKIESATQIGLLPTEFAQKIALCGNAAGSGAVMALLNSECLEQCKKIAQKASYLELSGNLEFDDLFIDYLSFEQ